MNPTVVSPLIGRIVYYVRGSRMDRLSGKRGTIHAVRENVYGEATHYGVEFADEPELIWAAAHAWSQPIKSELTDIEAVFAAAVGGPLEAAKAELARVEARAQELRDAIKVIESVTNG